MGHFQSAVLDLTESVTISLDYQLHRIAIGDVTLVQVLASEDGRSHPGDILIMDQKPPCDCDDDEYLLLKYHERFIVRQKKYVQTALNRSRLVIVGSGTPSPIKVVGHLIGWLHAPPVTYYN